MTKLFFISLSILVSLYAPAFCQTNVWPELGSEPSVNESLPIQYSSDEPHPEIVQKVAVHLGEINLSELIDLALSNNQEIKIQRAKIQEAQAQAGAAGQLPNPNLTVGRNTISEEAEGPVYMIEQELPINGVLGLEKMAESTRAQSESQYLMRLKQEIKAKVQEGYIKVLAAHETENLTYQLMNTAREALNSVSGSYEAGVSSALTLRVAQTKFSAAKLAYETARNGVHTARQELSAVLGIPESSLPEVGGDLKQSLLPNASSQPTGIRYDLHALDVQQQAAQLDISASRRARLPNPVVTYQNEENNGVKTEYYLLGFEVPLFNTGRADVRVKETQAASLKAEKNKLAQQISAEIESASSILSAKRRAVDIYEHEIIPLTDLSLSETRRDFEMGNIEKTLLLETQSHLQEELANYIQILTELRQAEIAYLLACGLEVR